MAKLPAEKQQEHREVGREREHHEDDREVEEGSTPDNGREVALVGEDGAVSEIVSEAFAHGKDHAKDGQEAERVGSDGKKITSEGIADRSSLQGSIARQLS